MEPLSTAVVAVLTVFLKESAKGVGTQLGAGIGAAALKKAKELYQAVRRKLKPKAYGEIDKLEKDPDDPQIQSELGESITKAMMSDHGFQQQLLKILQQYSESGGDKIFKTNISGPVQNLYQFQDVSGVGVVHAGVFIQNRGAADVPPSLDQAMGMIENEAYAGACTILKKVIANTPQLADAYYLMALALLGGRRPRTLTHSKAKQIVDQLAQACRLDNRQAHFFLLWALVQLDYFEAKGFDADPEVEQLIVWADNLPIDRRSFRRLLAFLPRLKSNYVYEIIADATA
jgi:hypothetical protein